MTVEVKGEGQEEEVKDSWADEEEDEVKDDWAAESEEEEEDKEVPMETGWWKMEVEGEGTRRLSETRGKKGFSMETGGT